jgi:hypothetical protein
MPGATTRFFRKTASPVVRRWQVSRNNNFSLSIGSYYEREYRDIVWYLYVVLINK